jgi:hypothetical protein
VPKVSEFGGIFFAHAALFLANECPDFIALDVLAVQIAHPLVHQFKAGLASENQQPHDCVAMQSGSAPSRSRRAVREPSLSMKVAIQPIVSAPAKNEAISAGIGQSQ